MKEFTYDEAIEVARVAAKYSRHDIPCPGAAVKKLLERIESLEKPAIPDTREAFIEGWMAARAHYGTTDENGQEHGAECDNPDVYICICDEEDARQDASESAVWFLTQG